VEHLIHEQDLVARFFAFNLCTADQLYLEKLIGLFSVDIGEERHTILKGAAAIGSALKEIRLDEFHQQTRYDFYPLLLSLGRLVHQSNVMATGLHTSALNPLFEHLSPISLYARVIETCILHTLWHHMPFIFQLVQQPGLVTDYKLYFPKAFADYNFDYAVVSACPDCYQEVFVAFDQIQGCLVVSRSNGFKTFLDDKKQRFRRRRRYVQIEAITAASPNKSAEVTQPGRKVGQVEAREGRLEEPNAFFVDFICLRAGEAAILLKDGDERPVL
jgi:hypothetical protein